ncbi:hypothetical protein E2C01_035260 [Portunus trituberculatus]|uniref:Uncharacterized protein n=1 Tax=Portunus trituberculatus TaxID=210409 RepID=A0A5B7F2Q7_PORTR|nr:hypothetical protein [Portunus trituberculatus]
MGVSEVQGAWCDVGMTEYGYCGMRGSFLYGIDKDRYHELTCDKFRSTRCQHPLAVTKGAIQVYVFPAYLRSLSRV